VLAEHSSAEGIDLTEGDGSHPGSFEPETESANAAEEIEDIHATQVIDAELSCE
jgi:hypothetical protein